MSSLLASRRFLSLRHHLPLLVILALALLLRITNVIGPVRGDDFTYLSAANSLFDGEINTSVCCGLSRIGIYWPIAIIYQLLGASYLTGFLFPLLASLSTVVSIHSIGGILRNKETGLLAAFLWAVFPLDILQSTQLLPDSIATALSAAAVLFMLLAFRQKGGKRLALFGLMAFCLLWIFYVKDLNLIVGVFCTLYIAYKYWWGYLRSFSQFLASRFSNLVLASAGLLIMFASAYLLVRLVLQFPPSGALAAVSGNATDIAEALLVGSAPLEVTDLLPRTGLFDLFLPLALLAVFVLARRPGAKSGAFVFGWIGIYLLVMEWGADFNFSSFPILYNQPNPFLVYDRRHILFMFVPIVLALALLLEQGVRKQSVRIGVPLVASISALVWLGIDEQIYAWQPVPLLDSARALTLIGAVSSPVWLGLGDQKRWQEWALLGFLGLFAIATFVPVPRYSAVDWQDDRRLMDNYRDAANYLLETEATTHIITIPPNETRLNYASDFRLGYNWEGSTAQDSQARIIDSDELAAGSEPAYIVFERDASHLLPSNTNPLWMRLAEFGSESDPSGLILYRLLTPEEAQQNWTLASSQHEANPTPETLTASFHAALNVENFQAAIGLLPDLRASVPDFDPLPHIQLFSSWLHEESPEQTSSLITGLSGLMTGVQLDPGLQLLYTPQTQPNFLAGLVLLTLDSPQTRVARIEIPLQPNHVYLMKATIRSSIPVQILDLEPLGINDSRTTRRNYPNWTRIESAFVTPESMPGDIFDIALFELLGTALTDEGELAIQAFQLIEINPAPFTSP